MATVVSYRAFDGPDITSSIGPIHGFLFIAYVVAVLAWREKAGWGVAATTIALAASVVPFLGFYVAERMIPSRSVSPA